MASPHDVSWLPPLEEAVHTTVTVKLHDNKARKGDSDYKAPGATPGHGLPKAPGSAQQDQLHPHGQAGTRQGGQFIKKGDTGTPVETVQKDLGISVDGKYDAGTAAAVVAFQQRHGLEPDGVIGRQTALALTGQFSRARRVGPGPLGPYTSKLVGKDARPKPASGKKAKAKKAPGKSGERVGGGLLVAGEDASPLAENVTDAHGKIHDLIGRFAPKLGGGSDKGHPAGLVPSYDPGPLKFGGSAGGSNGARVAKHRDGSKWLVKTYGGNEDRVATELLSNAVYRHLGARVPRAGKIKLHNGKTALAYPMLDGKPKPYVFQRPGARPSAAVGEHFMADALLANWDVAGLEDDNILWDKGGNPFRVDQGGTLEYRAMGGRKDFGPVPLEVTTMLSSGQSARSALVDEPQMRAQAGRIAAALTPETIDQMVAGVGFKDQAMAGRVSAALKARVAWMGRFSRGEVSAPSAPLKEREDPVAFWLEEAYTEYVDWKEALHPRGEHGKFVKKIGGLTKNVRLQLDSKTFITRDKDGTFRVTRSGAITKGFSNPADAARHALDKSVKSKDADSVGTEFSYASFNAYLQARGVEGVQSHSSKASGDLVHFGGGIMTKDELGKEIQRLKAAESDALTSGDKYVQKSANTLTTRLHEAQVKYKALGGDLSSLGSAPAPANPQTSSTPIIDLAKKMGTLKPGQEHVLPNGVKIQKKIAGEGYHVFSADGSQSDLLTSKITAAKHALKLDGQESGKLPDTVNTHAEIDALPAGTTIRVKHPAQGTGKPYTDYTKTAYGWKSSKTGGLFPTKDFGFASPIKVLKPGEGDSAPAVSGAQVGDMIVDPKTEMDKLPVGTQIIYKKNEYDPYTKLANGKWKVQNGPSTYEPGDFPANTYFIKSLGGGEDAGPSGPTMGGAKVRVGSKLSLGPSSWTVTATAKTNVSLKNDQTGTDATWNQGDLDALEKAGWVHSGAATSVPSVQVGDQISYTDEAKLKALPDGTVLSSEGTFQFTKKGDKLVRADGNVYSHMSFHGLGDKVFTVTKVPGGTSAPAKPSAAPASIPAKDADFAKIKVGDVFHFPASNGGEGASYVVSKKTATDFSIDVGGSPVAYSEASLKQLTATYHPKAGGGSGKKVSGMQENVHGENGGPASLKMLDLSPGDVVQFKKGGWKYTVTEVTPHGPVKVKAANGNTKTWGGYAKPKFIQKADKTELALKPPKSDYPADAPKIGTEPLKQGDTIAMGDQSPWTVTSAFANGVSVKSSNGVTADWDLVDLNNLHTAGWKKQGGLPSTAAAANDLTPIQIKAKLNKGLSTSKMTDYGDGTVIGTPDGKIAILKPGDPAYSGYVAAYDITSGQKLEVPAGKSPALVSTETDVKAAAAAALAKVHGQTSVTTAGSTKTTHDVGPPPAFDGVASWHDAKPHIPSAGQSSVGLTQEEKEAIRQYTNGAYGTINKILRDSKSVADVTYARMAAQIKKALRKGEVKQDVWIGRRTNNDMWKSEAVAGKVIQDNGVMSSSTSQGVWDGNIHLNVLIRKGSHALHVKSISEHPSEDEVLMPPGSMFHVLKREEKGSSTVLYVELIT